MFKDMTKSKKAKVDKKKAQSPVHLSEHGRYQIKSGLLAGEFVARAFAKPPTKTRGLIAEASGKTEDIAIAALQDIIDAREARRMEVRRKDTATDMAVPSVEEYAEALDHVALTRPQRAMLFALSLAGDDGLTDAMLANSVGYTSQASATRSLANAGRLIAGYLSSETGPDVQSTALDGDTILASRGSAKTDAHRGNWILHPELRDAVRGSL